MRVFRIVLDTNVLVSALRSRDGFAFKLLTLLETDAIELLLSTALILEYEMVLKRSGISVLTFEEIEQVINNLCSFGSQQNLWYGWRPLLSDPGDDFIAELAVNGQADFVVTYNKKHFEAMKRFDVQVVNPKEMLEILTARL